MPLAALKQQITTALQNKDFAAAHAVCASAQNIDMVDLSILRGAIFEAEGNKKAALDAWRLACAAQPANRDLLFAYANLCGQENIWDEAYRVFTLLAIQNPNDINIAINAGKSCKSIGHYEDAEKHYRRALVIGDARSIPQINFNYASLLLMRKNWAEGFAAYEYRLHLSGAMSAPWGVPTWDDGLPKNSRILVWSDQGMGDAIMFARFIPDLIARGYRVSVFVQTPLKELFASMNNIDAVFDAHDEPQKFDAAVPFASLPYILNASPETSWRGAYFSASPKTKNQKPKIGFVWAGNPNHVNDKNRSMKFTDIASLFDRVDVDFHSLQLGQMLPPTYQAHIHNDASKLADFAATARTISEFDLLICVDTAIAHLAGAMGIPTWVALPAVNGDWRWGITGDTTFWYPSMRLFRATKPMQWHDVITAMRAELTHFYGVS